MGEIVERGEGEKGGNAMLRLTVHDLPFRDEDVVSLHSGHSDRWDPLRKRHRQHSAITFT